MHLIKSIFSYIIMAVFAFFCGICIFCVLEAAGFAQVFGWSRPVLAASVCIYLLFIAAVFTALCAISMKIRKYIRDKERAEAVLSVGLPVLIILGIVVYLVFYVIRHVPIILHDTTFYRMALVTAGNVIPRFSQGTSSLYVLLLHGMLLIFGNTPFGGLVLQFVLFFISLLLLYIGMQAYAGTIPAAAAIAGFGFFPVTIEYVFSLTPDFFNIVLYLFGFYLTGVLYHKFCRAGITSLWQYVFLFFAGLYTGFLIYLDIYSVSLYLLFAVWYSSDKEKNKQAFGANCIALLGGIGGFFLSVAVRVLLLGNLKNRGSFVVEFGSSFRQSVAFYLEKLAPARNDILKVSFSYDGVSAAFFILLISLAFFMAPAVFRRKRSPGGVFVLNAFLLYGLSYWGLIDMQGQIGEILCWCMLAGLGLWGVVSLPQRQTEEPAEEDIHDMPGENLHKDADKKEIQKMDMKNMMTETNAAKKEEQEGPAPGKPLHNPLPVPVKRRRLQADFAYPVAEADMKFDKEVADNDDFDV